MWQTAKDEPINLNHLLKKWSSCWFIFFERRIWREFYSSTNRTLVVPKTLTPADLSSFFLRFVMANCKFASVLECLYCCEGGYWWMDLSMIDASKPTVPYVRGRMLAPCVCVCVCVCFGGMKIWRIPFYWISSFDRFCCSSSFGVTPRVWQSPHRQWRRTNNAGNITRKRGTTNYFYLNNAFSFLWHGDALKSNLL